MNFPRHPKAKHFHGLGLLAGVQSFTDLEARIAALPTEHARGAALEIFAEACLATQRVYQAREVWPGNSMPSALRQQLCLPMADMGVDGVFVTAADEPVCYQSKFRTGRPALTWTELSTFYGLADVGGRRLVFTNCDLVARVAEERMGAIFVRGSDLDRLTPEDFQIIEAWLAEQPLNPKRKTPDPHQLVALDEIVGGLLRGPRATALMACGSGKTLVALWTAERLDARTVLILLPSLALVRQTLHVWLHETSWPDVQFLCVCSDPTVQGEDSLLVRPADLDFAVTTKSADVRRFLERPTDSVRLVFSTYQSTKVVAEAVAGLPPFDFAVFDEAHKTAGRDGARFALALKDENLSIARRLFMTATPRHYDVARKDKFGESKVVFSMDVPETYGPVVHRLPFSAAAKAGIITDYKVIISVVTSEMITDAALRFGVVLVDGDEVKARQVANQIALKSAIEKYNVSKVFTFHSKVASAKSFTSEGTEGISTHLESFHCAHIEGAMTTAYRERLMRDFAAMPRAILSNARCLTEGVDVPAVDMVAFLSPKRSLVDIVQATGRAMRLSPETGKEFGYVLVPLYVEKARGETIEQAVLRSNFDEVWKVLQGLKEQDDLLAQIISEMRMERGRTGGYDDSQFRKRIEFLCPELSLEMLRSTITAACIDAIGENWFERYGQLVAYKQQHGDCDMPARWPANQKLASWVVDQRVRKRDHNLESEKIDLLNRLSFNWNPRQTNWRGIYLELVKFQKRFGHCRVPQNWKENNSLAHWVKTQRQDFAKSELHGDRIALLEKIGFEWRVEIGTWDDRFAELCAFKERFGHTRVTVKWPENSLLGGWVSTQRGKHRKMKLAEEYVQRLNAIGFEWDGRTAINSSERLASDSDAQWRKVFDRFKAYAGLQGAQAVHMVDAETKSLRRWMLAQRLANSRGNLSETRYNALNETGFVWTRSLRRTGTPRSRVRVKEFPITRIWDEMYSDLVEFFKLNGHCNVPELWSAQPELPRWIAVQRRAKKQNQLTTEHASRMEEIGFAWTSHDGGWDAMFAKLAEQMRPMNNGKPRESLPSVELKRWMLTQRQSKKRGELDPEREKRLTSIGFEWEPFSAQWEKMLAELKQFHVEHGHCRVPTGWAMNSVLANWVGVQRARKIDGKLSAVRQRSLDTLGFTWRLGEFRGTQSPQEAWGKMLERLVAFHAENGHAYVPQAYPQDRKLGRWVMTQRQKRRKGKLTAAQIKALDRLNIDWSLFGSENFNDRWKSMLARLLAFCEQVGHCRVPAGWKDDQQLANWVGVQRRQFKFGKLPQDRIQLLDSMGFDWVVGKNSNAYFGVDSIEATEKRWNGMFEKLCAYKAEHGDCLVQQGWKLDVGLANWVTSQRMANNRGLLKFERILRLREIGFDWDPIVTRWEEMFQQLVKFKDNHGHTNVSQRQLHYKELATWVRNQRKAMVQNQPIMLLRAKRLDEIGFVWRIVEQDAWESMFDSLMEFKQDHGHCNVPQKGSENQKLGKWVNTMRWHFKQGKLSADRIRQLERLGFVWNTKAK
jgi:superfamily II DNA or RNA helicase